MKSSRSTMVDSSRSRGSKKDDGEKSSRSSYSGRGDTLPKINNKEAEDKKDDFDEMLSRPTMFGDPFGNRGDYSKGIFYGGRKRFLYEGKGSNALEPPNDFMTMRQRKNKWEMSKTQVQLVSKRLDFKRKDDSDEAAILARAEAKKNLQQSKRKVMVIKHHPTSKYDWVVQRQAGCKFWLHKPTGTTSNERPYTEDEDDDSLDTHGSQDSQEFGSPNKNLNYSFLEEDSREDDDASVDVSVDQLPATGSLVYNCAEFDNLMNMLDTMQEEEAVQAARIKAAKNRKKK